MQCLVQNGCPIYNFTLFNNPGTFEAEYKRMNQIFRELIFMTLAPLHWFFATDSLHVNWDWYMKRW